MCLSRFDTQFPISDGYVRAGISTFSTRNPNANETNAKETNAYYLWCGSDNIAQTKSTRKRRRERISTKKNCMNEYSTYQDLDESLFQNLLN